MALQGRFAAKGRRGYVHRIVAGTAAGAGMADVEVSANEWARAANLRNQYWLYVVYDCATPNPRLVRVPDPFGTLLARAKGSMLISPAEIVGATDMTRH